MSAAGDRQIVEAVDDWGVKGFAPSSDSPVLQ
jgi:hypothetical protein